ncbi:MAG: hypothetical protein U9O64_05475 [Campylobacterota bacterium]|nr:hypothetical protein [Campylobacterota bacterium]
MSTIFKYFTYTFILCSLLILYLLYTPQGNKSIYDYVSDLLSQKSGLQVEVKSIQLHHYSQVTTEMNIERKAKLILTGELDDTSLDMNYVLTSECIASDVCKIDDNIDISGHAKGPFSRLDISGKGKALDGNVTYAFLKSTDKVEDLKIVMHDVNSTKLLTLLGQDALIKGKADVTVAFEMMSENSKLGSMTYDVRDNNFSGIPLNLHTKVDIVDMQHTFIIDITSPYLQLNISKGHYHQEKKLADAFYTLDIKDISRLETLLGYKYLGRFYAMGEIKYDKYLKISGLSKSFGGMIDFLFEKDGLHVKLNAVSFLDFMSLFPYPPMLDAEATGDLYYNFFQKTLVVNTTLNRAKIVHEQLINIIHNKTKVNLKREIFENSILDASYHNGLLLGDIKLKNRKSRLFLTNILMDTNQSTLNAYFDVHMQRQAFSGKLFGPLDSPEVDLNMQKLIRYQMNKQLDSIIGENNRKVLDKIPVGGAAKEMATGMGASFIKIFF